MTAPEAGLEQFVKAIEGLDAWQLEEAAKQVVQRLSDAGLMRHRGWCFDEEPARRERERAIQEGATHAVQRLREQGALATPQDAKLPATMRADGIGAVSQAVETVPFLPGEHVLWKGHILQKTALTDLPNDFTDRTVWLDVTPPKPTTAAGTGDAPAAGDRPRPGAAATH
ncbi:hypothetical protein [Corynebacterium sp. DNF00584]|uniref:hypothetical protein n=1 Tax=Corynebacterium sp. DNF00584 TaxID=1384076 RepID=UPI000796D2AE|nr:hypothetical protein [Corynebacterium sp. DNF00584]KXB52720.1 hypothetical protein HMPREF0307_02038 [Corynebacterium sp. DNF00584]